MILGDIFYGNDLPERQTADLPESGKTAIDRAISEAGQPIEQSYKNIDSDLGVGRDTYNQGFLGINDAIKQKYAGLLGSSLNDAKTSLRLNARSNQLDNYKRAQTAMLARTQVQNDIFAKNMQMQQMREAARAEALSSILGFGGALGGYKMAQNQRDDENYKGILSGIDQEQNTGGMSTGGSRGMSNSMNYKNRLERNTEAF